MVLSIGIHRKRRADCSGGEDLVNIECCKRTFWAAYILDK
jgi:hypothetical protein